jgi:hypothetical protein
VSKRRDNNHAEEHTIGTLVQTLVTTGDRNSAIGSEVPSLSRETRV